MRRTYAGVDGVGVRTSIESVCPREPPSGGAVSVFDAKVCGEDGEDAGTLRKPALSRVEP